MTNVKANKAKTHKIYLNNKLKFVFFAEFINNLDELLILLSVQAKKL